MVRRWFQFLLVGILTVATLTPLLEIFDRWDVLCGPWNDTELGVTALFLGIAISLTIAFLLRVSLVSSLQNIFLGLLPLPARDLFCTEVIGAESCASIPPLIPLRI